MKIFDSIKETPSPAWDAGFNSLLAAGKSHRVSASCLAAA